MMVEALFVCPIKGVAEVCKHCEIVSIENCVYVIVWRSRGKPSTSSPYKPLG